MPGCEILDLDNEEETMIDLDEENTKLAIPRSKMGSNDMRNTPTKIGSIQYVQHRDKSSTIEIQKEQKLENIVMTNYVWMLLARNFFETFPKIDFVPFKC